MYRSLDNDRSDSSVESHNWQDSISNEFEEYSVSSISSSLLESLEEDMERDERLHEQYPIQHLQRCIGMYVINYEQETNTSQFLFVIRISPETFYKYPIDDLEYYLTDFYSFDVSGRETIILQNLDILQIYYDYSYPLYDDNSNVITTIEPIYRIVVKTIWLKLIQREWRKRCEQNKREIEITIRKRGHPTSQFHFQTRGRYPQGMNSFPQPRLKGLMAHYSQTHP